MKCNLKTREQLKNDGYVRDLGNLASIHKMGSETVRLDNSIPDGTVKYKGLVLRTDSDFFEWLAKK